MFENVLVAIADEDAGRDALELAAKLVARGGRLTLVFVNVIAPRPAPDSGVIGDAARRRFAQERLAALRDEAGVDADVTAVDARSLARGLRDLAGRERADLVVIGATRHDEFDRRLVGDDTRDVLGDARWPVAVAPAGYSSLAAAMQTVGVAYDGSPGGEEALALARKLAAERGSKLSAFETVLPRTFTHDPSNVQPEIDGMVETAKRRIATLGDVEPHAASADSVVEGIERFGASVDLLVMGPHRRRLVDDVVGGSTSERLADEASFPLLVLPSRDR